MQEKGNLMEEVGKWEMCLKTRKWEWERKQTNFNMLDNKIITKPIKNNHLGLYQCIPLED